MVVVTTVSAGWERDPDKRDMTNAKIRAAVALMAAMLITVAFSAPADAAIGQPSAQLNINIPPGHPETPLCRVLVNGHVPMSPAEAQQLIASDHRIAIRIWGDDPVSDDLLGGPFYLVAGGANRWIKASAVGLSFGLYVVIQASVLNEDIETHIAIDEIYAGVRLVNSSTATIRSAESNRKWGWFNRTIPPPGFPVRPPCRALTHSSSIWPDL